MAVIKGGCGAIVGIALALVVLAGCGSSSGGEDSLTKSEFVKKGNLICQRAFAKVEEARPMAFQPYHGPDAPVVHEEKVMLAILRPYETMTEELGELGTPEAEEAKAEAVVEAMEETVKRVHANPQSAVISNAPFEKANQMAKEYGLDRCSIF